MIFVAFAASSSVKNPITAVNFRPTVWATQKAMLMPASESARAICAPRPLRSSPSTRRQGVSDCSNPAFRAAASWVGPSTGKTSTAARIELTRVAIPHHDLKIRPGFHQRLQSVCEHALAVRSDQDPQLQPVLTVNSAAMKHPGS